MCLFCDGSLESDGCDAESADDGARAGAWAQIFIGGYGYSLGERASKRLTRAWTLERAGKDATSMTFKITRDPDARGG